MKHLPRTQETVNRNLRDRMRNEERGRPANPRPTTSERAPFSHSGSITVTTAGDEPEWDVEIGGQVTAAVVRLKTAGTTDTVFEFFLNGSSMGTVTLGSGVTRKVAYLGDYRGKNGDAIGGRITTAGTGAKGLSAFVRMKG